jgi:ribose transport system ATP-binding protein
MCAWPEVRQSGRPVRGPRGTEMLNVLELTKSFDRTHALRGVSLEVSSGEIHGLIGQNGSGKSTLIKILSGFHRPDDGVVMLRGEPVSFPVRNARELGIAVVHQDLALVDEMTVVENVAVATNFYARPFRPLDWRGTCRQVARVSALYGLDLPADVPVRDLEPAEKALVAILRALVGLDLADGVQPLLILDEPTVYLGPADCARLFAAMRGLTRAGAAVIFVAHRLAEIRDVCDRVTVLRDGQVVASTEMGHLDEAELTTMILGRQLQSLASTRTGTPPPPDNPIALTAESLSGRRISNVDLMLRRGAVAGFTGLKGTGYEELPYLLVGAAGHGGGTVTVGGVRVSPVTPSRIAAAGVTLVSGERRQGLWSAGSVLENLMVLEMQRNVAGGWLRHNRERRDSERLIERFSITPPAPDAEVAVLSGGNQQKVILARALGWDDPSVLLLHEPSQGVDVGVRADIHRFIRECAARGTAVAIFSSDADELAVVCDEVSIVSGGRISSVLSGASISADALAEACTRS